MKISGINNIEAGSVVARPIYDANMKLLLNKGMVLSIDVIDGLRKRGYKYIYIQEDGTDHIEVEEDISVDVSRRVVNDVDKTFQNMRTLSGGEQNTLKIVSDKLSLKGKFDHLAGKGSFWKNVVSLVETLFYRNKPSISSFSLSLLGTSPLSHAMDVTILCILLARRFHYELKELISFATAALLHDSGMQFMPEISDKPYFLLDEKEIEIYRKHPRLGFKVLEMLKNFSMVETQTVLQHHEQQDGLGFPNGHRGNNDEPLNIRRQDRGHIFRWAEILAVADRYVRYCSGDLTEIPQTPTEAIACLIKDSGTVLNQTVVREVGSIINIFPKGATVKIEYSSDRNIIGYQGVVCKDNQENMDKPEIILLRTKQGVKIKPTLIDLKKDEAAKLKLLFDL